MYDFYFDLHVCSFGLCVGERAFSILWFFASFRLIICTNFYSAFFSFFAVVSSEVSRKQRESF